jgi:hypothetical protein
MLWFGFGSSDLHAACTSNTVASVASGTSEFREVFGMYKIIDIVA